MFFGGRLLKPDCCFELWINRVVPVDMYRPSVSRHPGVNCVRRVSTGGDEWFIMNRDLLLPEYIIHYNYVSSNVRDRP